MHMGASDSCQCQWLNCNNVELKKWLNCGVTEIELSCGLSGEESRTLPMQVLLQRMSPQKKMIQQIFPRSFRWQLLFIIPQVMDYLKRSMTVGVSVSQRGEDENFGDSKQLNVGNNPDSNNNNKRQRQSLVLFDLTFVTKSFVPVIGRATLSIYLASSSDSGGGVTLKKMANTHWVEDGVTWSNAPNSDILDEPIILSVDNPDCNAWCGIGVTTTVMNALENNNPHLGIQIVSNDETDF